MNYRENLPLKEIRSTEHPVKKINPLVRHGAPTQAAPTGAGKTRPKCNSSIRSQDAIKTDVGTPGFGDMNRTTRFMAPNNSPHQNEDECLAPDTGRTPRHGRRATAPPTSGGGGDGPLSRPQLTRQTGEPNSPIKLVRLRKYDQNYIPGRTGAASTRQHRTQLMQFLHSFREAERRERKMEGTNPLNPRIKPPREDTASAPVGWREERDGARGRNKNRRTKKQNLLNGPLKYKVGHNAARGPLKKFDSSAGFPGEGWTPKGTKKSGSSRRKPTKEKPRTRKRGNTRDTKVEPKGKGTKPRLENPEYDGPRTCKHGELSNCAKSECRYHYHSVKNTTKDGAARRKGTECAKESKEDKPALTIYAECMPGWTGKCDNPHHCHPKSMGKLSMRQMAMRMGGYSENVDICKDTFNAAEWRNVTDYSLTSDLAEGQGKNQWYNWFDVLAKFKDDNPDEPAGEATDCANELSESGRAADELAAMSDGELESKHDIPNETDYTPTPKKRKRSQQESNEEQKTDADDEQSEDEMIDGFIKENEAIKSEDPKPPIVAKSEVTTAPHTGEDETGIENPVVQEYPSHIPLTESCTTHDQHPTIRLVPDKNESQILPATAEPVNDGLDTSHYHGNLIKMMPGGYCLLQHSKDLNGRHNKCYMNTKSFSDMAPGTYSHVGGRNYNLLFGSSRGPIKKDFVTKAIHQGTALIMVDGADLAYVTENAHHFIGLTGNIGVHHFFTARELAKWHAEHPPQPKPPDRTLDDILNAMRRTQGLVALPKINELKLSKVKEGTPTPKALVVYVPPNFTVVGTKAEHPMMESRIDEIQLGTLDCHRNTSNFKLRRIADAFFEFFTTEFTKKGDLQTSSTTPNQRLTVFGNQWRGSADIAESLKTLDATMEVYYSPKLYHAVLQTEHYGSISGRKCHRAALLSKVQRQAALLPDMLRELAALGGVELDGNQITSAEIAYNTMLKVSQNLINLNARSERCGLGGINRNSP